MGETPTCTNKRGARADYFFTGFGMAKNLRAKVEETDDLYICDVNAEATKRFVEETGKGVHVAKNPREVAQKCVCETPGVLPHLHPLMILLSMI